MLRHIVGAIVLLVLMVGLATADDASRYMQELSVTVKSAMSEGSGVVITHDMKEEKDSKETVPVCFILTAGHVVDDLRKTRKVINSEGDTKTVIEFKDGAIVKERNQKGRRVGETKLDVRVLKFSDADNGEDLALMMVRWYGFSDKRTEFFLADTPEEEMVDVGEELWHCGSLLGQMGANSMTRGIMSQIGRVHEGKVYDQTTVTAFPGSSGGGVWIKQEKGNPLYVGMIVRGAGETFNLMVPVRRIHTWAKRNNVEWVLNPKLEKPSLDELVLETIEDQNKGIGSTGNRPDASPTEFIFLDGEHEQEWKSRGLPTVPLP
jgi:hypothetical protein